MVATQIPTVSRFPKTVETSAASTTLEAKFASDVRIVGDSGASSAVHSVGRAFGAPICPIARDYSVNEAAIATIWLIFFALLIGASVVSPLSPEAINLSAMY
jgi:hypothetical protein